MRSFIIALVMIASVNFLSAGDSNSLQDDQSYLTNKYGDPEMSKGWRVVTRGYSNSFLSDYVNQDGSDKQSKSMNNLDLLAQVAACANKQPESFNLQEIQPAKSSSAQGQDEGYKSVRVGSPTSAFKKPEKRLSSSSSAFFTTEVDVINLSTPDLEEQIILNLGEYEQNNLQTKIPAILNKSEPFKKSLLRFSSSSSSAFFTPEVDAINLSTPDLVKQITLNLGEYEQNNFQTETSTILNEAEFPEDSLLTIESTYERLLQQTHSKRLGQNILIKSVLLSNLHKSLLDEFCGLEGLN